MDEVKKNRWRPLLFKTPEELQKKIDEYFDSCYEDVPITEFREDPEGDTYTVRSDWDGSNEHKVRGRYVVVGHKKRQIQPFSIGALAYFLNCSRMTLINYEGRDDFFDTIKKAKDRIEMDIELSTLQVERKNIAGPLFNLKNNFEGWYDKQQVENRYPDGFPEVPVKAPPGGSRKYIDYLKQQNKKQDKKYAKARKLVEKRS